MQIKEELKILQLHREINLKINKQILDKIKFLCNNMKNVEWSGILFYKLRGTMSKPDKMSIEIKDIFLMDKGNRSHTGFSWDSDLVEYQMNNPISIEEDWIKGLIHSHNTMNVFFSKEDIDELRINTPLHNIYLSLIVNNYMEMIARLCFIAKSNKYNTLNESGKNYNIEIAGSENEVLMYYRCNIIHPDQYIPSISDEFENRYKAINEKSKLIEASKVNINSTIINNIYNPKKPDTIITNKSNHIYNSDWGDDLSIDTPATINKEDRYICFILRFGSLLDNDTIIDILEDLDIIGVNIENYLESIRLKFLILSNSFFTITNTKSSLNTIVEYITKVEEKLENDYKGFLVKDAILKFLCTIKKELTSSKNIKAINSNNIII